VLIYNIKTNSINFKNIDFFFNSIGYEKELDLKKDSNLDKFYIFENLINPKGGFYPTKKEVRKILQGKSLPKIIDKCTNYKEIEYFEEKNSCIISFHIFTFRNAKYVGLDLFEIFKRYTLNERLTDNFPNRQLILLYDDSTFIFIENHCNKIKIDKKNIVEFFYSNQIENIDRQFFILDNFNY
jgi:hypothetical protein